MFGFVVWARVRRIKMVLVGEDMKGCQKEKTLEGNKEKVNKVGRELTERNM